MKVHNRSGMGMGRVMFWNMFWRELCMGVTSSSPFPFGALFLPVAFRCKLRKPNGYFVLCGIDSSWSVIPVWREGGFTHWGSPSYSGNMTNVIRTWLILGFIGCSFLFMLLHMRWSDRHLDRP